MRAILMWTINDFPAYGMLSGWSTAGKLACPICMDSTRSFTLKNGRKNSWFDCHRMFLSYDHPFRKNKDSFLKNRLEKSNPPRRLSGEEVFNIVSHIPRIFDLEFHQSRLPGFGVDHNWVKRSIFWDLSYWKDNLLRHNIDVMHTEKNFFDNIFNTVMDIQGKTKDNVKSRLDIKELCRRRELELIETSNAKFLKPKAKFTLTLEQRRLICEWVKSLKMPYGYASNLSRCVDMQRGLLFGLKSHDCHIFLQSLLPVAFSLLPEQIQNPLIEISLFFKELCSATLNVEGLRQLEDNIPVILCKLERIFPPSFFDSMEHLPVHLPYEAKVGGPVQYRWMYPFERFLNKLKRTVKNKAHPEGSICEAYLAQETTTFCSYYFETSIKSNEFHTSSSSNYTLSVFKSDARLIGKNQTRYLTDQEMRVASLHVLINCIEVQSILQLFVNNLNISDDVLIDRIIEEQFSLWFKNYVHNEQNDIDNEALHDLAWGPMRLVSTWSICDVNGFRFHTDSWSEGRKTYNAGVSVRGTAESIDDTNYYGIIKEIVQLQYPGPNARTVVLFCCDWFDPTPNRGTKKHKYYDITEVHMSRKYNKFDPFIIASQASQVYYLRYPGRSREKKNWAVVVKTKPRAIIEVPSIIDVAHQETAMSLTNISAPDLEAFEHLQDENAEYEEINHDLGDSSEDEELHGSAENSTYSSSNES